MPPDERKEKAERLRSLIEREDIVDWLCGQLKTIVELGYENGDPALLRPARGRRGRGGDPGAYFAAARCGLPGDTDRRGGRESCSPARG